MATKGETFLQDQNKSGGGIESEWFNHYRYGNEATANCAGSPPEDVAANPAVESSAVMRGDDKKRIDQPGSQSLKAAANNSPVCLNGQD